LIFLGTLFYLFLKNLESPVRSPMVMEASAAEHIELVPEELIRREGSLSYKIKKEFGGVEPKKQHSWHSSWGIVCVGYLVLYKDEPAKLKKVQGCLLILFRKVIKRFFLCK
jgi:hypothetical protein